MPLEIRQIGIRMEVAGEADAGDGAPQGNRQSGAVDLLEAHDGGGDESDRAELIEQCVSAVLAELARRSER